MERPVPKYIENLATGFKQGTSTLLEALHAIHQRFGYLPWKSLEQFCDVSKLPLSSIYSFASFHSNFRLGKKPPPVIMKVCESLPCYLSGSAILKRHLEDVFGKLHGDTCEIVGCACIGLCDGAPAMLLNHRPRIRLDRRKARERLLREVESMLLGRSCREEGESVARFESLASYRKVGGYKTLEGLLKGKLDPQEATQKIKVCGLRGMGGAGFDAALKWELVRKEPGPTKYVICNAEEGEPGTFKDRMIMKRHPHRIVEGMLCAALVVGAKRCFICLRDEYKDCRRIIQRCLEELKKSRLLSRAGIHVSLVISAGPYICGEETALMESIEGKRGEPRMRPPYPSSFGLWGRPTLVHNVETLALASEILAQGQGLLRNQEAQSVSWKKIYSLSGDVNRPGTYKASLGISARELIYRCGRGPRGNRGVKAFFPGGVSSGFLPGTMLDVPLDFNSLTKHGTFLGTGGVIVVSEGRCMVDIAENCLSFFSRESCGKCTPCRIGTEKMVQMLRDLRQGEMEELELFQELSKVMTETSMCGLGVAAPNTVLNGLRYFKEEFQTHLHGHCPEGVCGKMRL